MKYKDYYGVLGVDRDADADTIKRAYKRLARKYHPDVSKEADAETRFKEVGEAYDVLKDPEKKEAYDALGDRWQTGESFRPPPDWNPFGSSAGRTDGFSFDDFADLFGDTIWNRGGAGTTRGADLHASLNVTLEELYRGEPVNIYVTDPARGQRHLKVKIPPHLRDGQSFRLRGQGMAAPNQGRSGANERGDLYVDVRLVPHPRFTVQGDDIYSELPVTPWEAVLGAKVPVPTLGGDVTLTIPQRSRDRSRLRLKHRGLPGDPPGHHYVELRIQVPPRISEEELAHYRALAEASTYDPRADEALSDSRNHGGQ